MVETVCAFFFLSRAGKPWPPRYAFRPPSAEPVHRRREGRRRRRTAIARSDSGSVAVVVRPFADDDDDIIFFITIINVGSRTGPYPRNNRWRELIASTINENGVSSGIWYYIRTKTLCSYIIIYYVIVDLLGVAKKALHRRPICVFIRKHVWEIFRNLFYTVFHARRIFCSVRTTQKYERVFQRGFSEIIRYIYIYI